MTRVKKAVNALKHRRKILERTKGFRHDLSRKERAGQEALLRAGMYSFVHRRDKKNDFRKIWNVKINSSLRPLGATYSKFINALKKKNITLDRKILAGLAENNPETFKRVVEQVK